MTIPGFKEAESAFWRLGQKHPKSYAIGFSIAGGVVGWVLHVFVKWMFR